MRKPITLVLLAAFAFPAWGQELAPKTGAESAAQTYRAAEWPEAQAPRVGVDPESIAVEGLTRSSLRVNARLGLARVAFADAETQAPAAQLSLRVHKDSQAARRALLFSLSSTQVQLLREAGLGPLTYGGRQAGRLDYAVGAIANVSFVIRGQAKTNVEPLAAAVARAVRAASLLEPGAAAPAPRVLACAAERVVVGEAARLRLDFDPGATPAAHLAFVCSEGAGVVETKDGYELYTSAPGPVTVQVVACSRELRVSVFTARFEAEAGR